MKLWTKHGHSNPDGGATGTYKSWHHMVQRCTNPNNDSYERYGGRGITVCTRWLLFKNFLEDMGERPAGTSLDRKNNSGNYELDNCRWATRMEQQNNTRRNKIIEFDGLKMSRAQWSRHLGLHVDVLRSRLRRGWSLERALRN